MSNPILEALGNRQTASQNPNPQALQSVKRMMNAVKFASNPKLAMEQLMSQNPQINNVMQMLNGRNPKDVFYEECQRHNIDPESVLNQLR